MPGNRDGKTRPSNDQYRKNFDDIFKKKTKEEDAKKEKANKEKAGQEKKT